MLRRQIALGLWLGWVAVTVGCWELKLSKLPDTDTPTDTAPDDADTGCGTLVCNDPPQKGACLSKDTVERYASNGYCEIRNGKAQCRYPTYVDTCLEGECRDGICVAVPLQGTTCLAPPAPKCDGDVLVSHYPIGTAALDGDGKASCDYSTFEVACAHGCKAGRCVDDPCAGVFCSAPPAIYCLDNNLALQRDVGRCSDAGRCVYDTRRADKCENVCNSGVFTNENRCDCITCLTPPADFCLDENRLYDYAETGICDNGACIYKGQAVTCENGCDKGRCQEDLCKGMSCIHPPAPRCLKDGRASMSHVSLDANPCKDGQCIFGAIEVCEKYRDCVDGECDGDPCEGPGIYCVPMSPQEPRCDGNRAVALVTTGGCTGHGFCEYDIVDTDCDVCDAGICVN